ncbi:MAG: hypothetical protein KDD94_03775 [Calditrichaeota bacterium]|nr:hypothetical protein [Calditrichota bacterium]
MKSHSIIPYFLLAFLTVVILLVGNGVGIAISYMMQTPDFYQFKNQIGMPDFISGADLLLTVYFCVTLFIAIGASRSFTISGNKTNRRILISVYLLIAASIFLIIPKLPYFEIKSEYMVLSLLAYAFIVRINIAIFEKQLVFISSIDLIFYLFKYAAVLTVLMLSIAFISHLENPFSFHLVKLILITYLFSFFCLLAGSLPYHSLMKMYYHAES